MRVMLHIKNMNTSAVLAGFCLAGAASLHADGFTITVSHDLDIARPGEVVVVPWLEVASRLPGVKVDQVTVKNGKGEVIPAQVTNFRPEVREGYGSELLFQHDFAAGEKTARFTVETTAAPVPPFPSRVFARYVPERFDDFAFENDRLAHRMYGPGLDSPAAERSRLKSSGIDVWAKRVSYPIVDRWYLKGHDNYHIDTGEGIDMFSVGPARGCGGTGVWDGATLHVSGNWAKWNVLANGPLRAVFELSYANWDAGGVAVSEVKRITVDAGRNFHQVESTFTFDKKDPLTIGIGLTEHKGNKAALANGTGATWLSLWEEYPHDGQLGTAVIPAEGASAEIGKAGVDNLVLVKTLSGIPLRYWVGAGWNKSGQYADRAAWEAEVAAFAKRAASPLRVHFEPVPRDLPRTAPTGSIPLWNGRDLTGLSFTLRDPDKVPLAKAWEARKGVLRFPKVDTLGYVRTEKAYGDYHLHVEWRWPEGEGNSGVMVHIQEPDVIWPGGYEAQLRTGIAGQFIAFGSTADFEGGEILRARRRKAPLVPSAEKPLGEWNSYDIFCRGDAIEIYVNGLLVNRARGLTLRSGTVALQTEGATIEFRNVWLRPLGKP